MTYNEFNAAMEENKTVYGMTNGIMFDIRNLDGHSCFIRTIIKANNEDESHLIYNITEETQMKTYWMIESNNFNWRIKD